MKISGKMSKFLTDTLSKMSQNILAYFSISEHFASFSLFQKRKPIFGYSQGVCPPPVYELVRSLKIFLRLPLATDVCLHQKVEQAIIYVCDMCIQGDCKFSTCLVKYTTAGSFLIHPVYARVIF